MGMGPGTKTSNFWLLARALGEFVKGEGGGLPPLSGEVTRQANSVQGREERREEGGMEAGGSKA